MSSTRKRTILLYGRSRSGKTSQIGEMAEHLYTSRGLKTRVYTADRGGVDPIRPHIEAGIIEAIEQGDTNPFLFLNKAARGHTRDAHGKWQPHSNPEIGMFAFESMTSFADALMADMVRRLSEGTNIGGGANVSFQIQTDGETLKVGGSNMAVFGVCQNRITEEVWASQKLPAEYILWTASVSKEDDPNASGKVLGPAVIGKALTTEVPRWFQLSFRIDSLPAQLGKPERHVLYLGNSVDLAAGNAVSLGNTRVPMGGKDLPTSIEPASLVKALALIAESESTALDNLTKRLATK